MQTVIETSKKKQKKAWKILPSKLEGELFLPPSKSQSLRALFFSSLSGGVCTIQNLLSSPDTDAVLRSLPLFGAKVQTFPSGVRVEGTKGKVAHFSDIIDVGNSGIALRFFSSLAALSSHPCVITGDHSIRYRRPMKDLIQGLRMLSVSVKSMKEDNFAPLIIQGPMQGGELVLSGEDSQPVSALLFSAAFSSNPTTIFVQSPGELPWIDLTLSWLDRLGIYYEREGYHKFFLRGAEQVPAFSYTVPSDMSSAAFPVALALLTSSTLHIKGWELSKEQGDQKLFSILKQMGAKFSIKNRECVVLPSKLKGGKFCLNDCIDALPILAVVGACAEGKTIITGVQNARNKESDRITVMCQELKKMGVKISSKDDGLEVEKSNLCGSFLFAHNDHRVALSLAVAAMAAKGESIISGVECSAKTYPNFCAHLKKAGGQIIECDCP